MKHNFTLSIVLVILLVACNNMGSGRTTENDPVAKNKAWAQLFYNEVFNKRSLVMLDSLVATSFLEHTPDPGYSPDLPGLKKNFADFFTAYPDLHAKINFIVAEGDLVTVHYTMTGTNSGPMAGMAATNKKMNIDGVDVLRLKDGKTTEHWGYSEQFKMMQQLGLIPEVEAANGKEEKDKEKK